MTPLTAYLHRPSLSFSPHVTDLLIGVAGVKSPGRLVRHGVGALSLAVTPSAPSTLQGLRRHWLSVPREWSRMESPSIVCGPTGPWLRCIGAFNHPAIARQVIEDTPYGVDTGGNSVHTLPSMMLITRHERSILHFHTPSPTVDRFRNLDIITRTRTRTRTR
ncbi:hypothetical protein BDV59DRAFT_126151 [Aspergillus ambiguus]|uniref:uncharacterized protein n=1 Tax=Aspergillus ambiguus TaxID=176160 RepID=UPI003CCDD126